MANKILVFDKLAFDPATNQYFQLILIDGGTSYSAYIKDVDAPTNPSLASNVSAIGATPVIAPSGAGDVVGLGTTNTIPLWTDGPNSVIGNSIITQSGSQVTVAGNVSLAQTGLLFGATNVFRIVGTMSSDSSLYLGDAAGAGSATGLENVGIGGFALNAITSGVNNTVLGFGAAFKLTNGIQNIAIGSFALFNAIGPSDDIAIGFNSLHNITSGGNNVALGNTTGQTLTTGTGNVLVGTGAGNALAITRQDITAVGSSAGQQSGNGGVYLGSSAGQAETGANKLYIANTNTTTPLIGGDFSAGTLVFNATVLYKESVSPQAATPVAVTAALSGTVYTNEGAGALGVFNLPTAAANLTYTFIVQDADGIQVTASAGDTIRLGASVSSVAGTATSTTIGSVIRLVAINATEWMAESLVGTWVTA